VDVLRGAGLEAAAGTESDVLVTLDLMPPVLVVLDDPGGREERLTSLRHLLAHPALVGIPIIVLSPDDDIDSYSSALTKGAAAYMVKPVQQGELLGVVGKLVEWVGTHERTEKRRRVRRPLIMRVDVDVRSSKEQLPGHLIDVSGGGCRLEVEKEIAVGEAVRIILHGYDASTYVALGAEVRWHERVSDGLHRIGCKFTGTTALLAGKLLGFVSSGTT
jgi:two-component system chemotaxis response regulator CheY